MKRSLLITSTTLLLSLLCRAQSQTALNDRSVTVAANAEYNRAGKFKRIMFGDHYRKEWATPVDVVILEMNEFAGGLTPVKMGGGHQTKSLRLKGADGKEYVLRSVNKDPSKALAEELRETFASDVAQDQISSANPYAPMVVASLEDAAGIFHSTPHLVYVEKSKSLGQFEEIFGGTICILEERPADDESNNAAFGYSSKIVNSEKLFQKVFTDADHQVDEKSFLKARLFDMLIGDWDRHEDQWLWAAFRENDKTVYRPIPRDRDQAFSKMDGVIPQLATKKWAIRRVQGFDYTIQDIVGLNINGSYLDRNFTSRLGLNDWLSVAKELQEKMTDSVINAAFVKMPAPIYQLSGKEISNKLKSRRNDLIKYAKTYYQFLSKEVSVVGTNKKEIFEVTRLNDDSTKVSIYEIDKEESKQQIFNRVFLRSETKEIRLYGMNGDDLFDITGNVDQGIIVRIIGGKGDDSIVDSSLVRRAGRQTKVYDDRKTAIVSNNEVRAFLSTDSLKNDYSRKSFALDWMAPVQAPGYNADDGFFIGAGIVYKKQKYGKYPYGYMQSIAANYAFATGAYSIGYKGIFKEFIAKSDLHVSAKYNSPTYAINYYGQGNETENDKNARKDYYHVQMSELDLSTFLSGQIGKKHAITFGTEFQTLKLGNNDSRFITNNEIADSSDFERRNYGTLQFTYCFNTTDNELYPQKGFKVEAGTSYTQSLNGSDNNFAQVFSETTGYLTVGRFTLASRTGVATNIGDRYEFYQANNLSGLTNLRGYRRDRFAGKTCVYQNTELRYKISEANIYVAKGAWGVLSFADHGRVWIPGEKSEQWHCGYGGGIWFLPFKKMALTATYAVSKEDKLLSVKTGFLF